MKQYIKSRQKRKWWFDKITYFSADRFQDSLHADLEDLTGATITLEQIFENEVPLAINHWIGVVKITHTNDDFEMFIVETAAGKDTVRGQIIDVVNEILAGAGLDFTKNVVNLFKPIEIIPKY
jgi:hypothetical protein